MGAAWCLGPQAVAVGVPGGGPSPGHRPRPRGRPGGADGRSAEADPAAGAAACGKAKDCVTLTAAAPPRRGCPTLPDKEDKKAIATPPPTVSKLLFRFDVICVVLTAACTVVAIFLLSEIDFQDSFGGAVPFWKVGFVLALTIAMVALMTFDYPTYPSEVVLIGGAAIFGLAEIIPSRSVLAGLSDTTVTSVAFLFPMARAISDTGALEVFVGAFLGTPKTAQMAVFRLCLLVGPLSAIVNNTPVTAMMVPVLDNWCARVGIDVAKLAMPLAFAAQLGGGLTLMGSPTNFAARKTYLKEGYNFGFFELTLVAAPLYGVGIAFFVIFAPLLLGTRARPADAPPEFMRQPSGDELDGNFRVAFRINPQGPFSRGTVKVGGAGFDRLAGVSGAQMVLRNGEVVWGKEVPGSEDVRLTAGDFVIFRASAEGVVELRKTGGLSLSTEPESHLLGRGRKRRMVFEVEVPPASGLLGGPLDCAALRARHGCALLAVRGRLHGEEAKAAHSKKAAKEPALLAVFGEVFPISDDTSDTPASRAFHPARWSEIGSNSSPDTPVSDAAVGFHEFPVPETATLTSFDGFLLQEGDVLLVEANPQQLGSPSWARDFGILRGVSKSAPPKLGRRRDTLRSVAAITGSAVAIGLFVLSNQVSGMDKFALTTNLIILVLFLLTTGTMTVDTIYESLNGRVLLTMVGAFPLGEAIQAVGLDSWAGRTLVALFSPLGKIGSYIAVYFVCAVLSNLISNIAVIAMVAPVSVQIAQLQGLKLQSMVVCTTLATSAVFTFPIGHQTNLMVVPLGKYGWGDFFKLGGTFQIVHGIACCLICMFMG